MTLSILLFLLALVMFIVAAFGVDTRRVNAGALGLAFMAAAFLVTEGAF